MTDSFDREDVTFNRAIDIMSLGEFGVEVSIEANEDQRRAIAARLGVPKLMRLTGEFRLKPVAKGVEVKFHLDAAAERQCVVSLEAMDEVISEDFSICFERSFHESGDDRDDGVVCEPLEGTLIVLGELLVQHLSLTLDPHPRKPGARSLLSDYRDAASRSPFAILKGCVDDER